MRLSASSLGKAAVLATVLVGCLPTICAAQAKPAVAAPTPTKPTVDPLKGLSSNYDKMRGITWYEHKATPKYRNSRPGGVYLYFGKSDNGVFTDIRLVLTYVSDDWLFVKRAWAKADGVTVELPQESGLMGWERDNGSGSIWEWSDKAVPNVQLSSIRTLANAKSVTVRFEGRQYHQDRDLTAQQLKAMREMLAAYDAASGGAVK